MAISEAQNIRLTRVGPDTPMGDLLRRYWHPIAAEAELLENPIKPVRLLAEDLILYRTSNGEYGLTEPHCPHRRAAFANGYVEPDGIRCSYHGWKFAPDGTCIEQPYEEMASGHTRFRAQICALTYRVEVKAGLVWAYLGPDPAPLIPTWEPFTFEHCFKQIVIHEVDCNWLQCQENSIDPLHFEWLHGNWTPGQNGHREAYSATHVRLGFEPWQYGLCYRRLHEGDDETSLNWRTQRLSMMPNLFAPLHFEWRVPIDDHRTLGIVWMFDRVPAEREPFAQDVIPCWHGRFHDDAGRPLTTHVLHQDVLTWTGQGRIADRTREHLGRSDEGVVMFRKQLEADLKAVAEGKDPSGLIRDPEQNKCIRYPHDMRDAYVKAPSIEALHQRLHRMRQLTPVRDNVFLVAGQPDDIRQQWEYAVALRDTPP